jgi:hypothetical protein
MPIPAEVASFAVTCFKILLSHPIRPRRYSIPVKTYCIIYQRKC